MREKKLDMTSFHHSKQCGGCFCVDGVWALHPLTRSQVEVTTAQCAAARKLPCARLSDPSLSPRGTLMFALSLLSRRERKTFAAGSLVPEVTRSCWYPVLWFQIMGGTVRRTEGLVLSYCPIVWGLSGRRFEPFTNPFRKSALYADLSQRSYPQVFAMWRLKRDNQ